ncbi:hypothetical protein MIMGU_mgv1a0173372mg, partial [Erythranthe guttata]
TCPHFSYRKDSICTYPE